MSTDDNIPHINVNGNMDGTPEKGHDEYSSLSSFSSLGLDARVLKAVKKAGLRCPTLVQRRCIPIVLSGRDMLIRARTGTGKTLTYALPLIHTMLNANLQSSSTPSSLALVLVPTRELCAQALLTLREMCANCSNNVSVVAAGSSLTAFLSSQSSLIMVGTPSTVLSSITSPLLKMLRMLVVDEADLVLSYGFDDDVDALLNLFSAQSRHQTILLSATLTPQLEKLKAITLHSAAVVQLKDENDECDSSIHEPSKLKQFVVKCPFADRFLILYTLLKFGPISGKSILFANDVNECFRLKLFLEGFSISSAILNRELPLNSRLRIVEQFNRGMFDLLITTDESSAEFCSEQKVSVSRGLDFKEVSNVINIGLPGSVAAYVHRVGRTSRGGRRGVAISIIDIHKHESTKMLDQIRSYYTGENEKDDEETNPVSFLDNDESHETIRELPFSIELVSAFQYRVSSVISAITPRVIREARVSELRHEMLASNRLKSHFEERPRELALLTHDKVLRPSIVHKHLRAIPAYLLPPGTTVPRANQRIEGAMRLAGEKMRRHGKFKKKRKTNNRMKDPLTMFSATGKKKRRR